MNKILILLLAVFCFCGCNASGRNDNPNVIKGQIVVGFDKIISQSDAEKILSGFGLEFIKTDDVNMGKVFFNETGAKFIVKVPEGEETSWVDKLGKIDSVKKAGLRIDPNKMLID